MKEKMKVEQKMFRRGRLEFMTAKKHCHPFPFAGTNRIRFQEYNLSRYTISAPLTVKQKYGIIYLYAQKKLPMNTIRETISDLYSLYVKPSVTIGDQQQK